MDETFNKNDDSSMIFFEMHKNESKCMRISNISENILDSMGYDSKSILLCNILRQIPGRKITCDEVTGKDLTFEEDLQEFFPPVYFRLAAK